ncbi:hypothetical protein Ahy_A02g005564 isoform B [Arachis hypogaea]|uniref:Exostosin GT47 domain-containing protein n=1 Tax=Arachis hypogaea TaxID=3818 RepID=A0A445E723_ARAHY|nr:hypothetical protein Ahy_A02g005564 isoform B [Arachis hypogaea]
MENTNFLPLLIIIIIHLLHYFQTIMVEVMMSCLLRRRRTKLWLSLMNILPQHFMNLIEAGLIQARAAIKEARNWNQTQDPDYVPLGPMYWNAKAFHRSYLEMEKQFKVFIYEEGEPPVFHNGPCLSIYSSEGHFINAMEINEQFRTRDPQKAHYTMMVKFVYKSDFDFGPIKRTTIDYINLIASRYPFWNRSLGADHFMLSCHDWGPVISFAIPNLHKNSIRVLCNANTSERFNPTKDVSFPEINLLKGSIDDFVGGPSPSQRPILAFYAGRNHGPVRPILLDHWFNKDKDIQLYKTLPKGVSYYSMLRKSKFCLCPSGYEVASPRVVEAIYTGCVPVLISDHYVPPFSEVMNWKSFSIEVSLKDIPKLKEILLSVSPRKYIKMQRRVGQIRRHFEVHYPPRRYDVFHMILHSVWLRRLNIKIAKNSITPSSSPSSSSLFINNGDDNKTMHAFDDHHMSFFNNLSYFSPPALSLPEQYNQTEVVDHDISKTWASSAPLNESYVVPQRKFSILDRTEAGLLQARAAIRDARNWNQTLDQDYVPIGPVYRNAKAFHRSYLEMEKQFKVFVYKEGEPPIFHNGPCKSIYSMEGNFIHAIEMNEQFRTRDPKKAHVFFLPFSVVMMVRFVYERNSRDFGPIRTTVKDYINLIAGRYPYWNRSLGADHFMLSCHDWGPETSFSIPYLYKNSIRVLCNANTSEGFNPTKDVSLPEINLQTGTIDGFLGGPSASKRSILAFFAGGVHGPIRPILLEQWENKDEDIKVHKYLPKGVSYYGMLRKSKFCLCPSGYEVASPRVVEAIYTGCVPVLISDHYVPPFSDVLNWKSFSVEVSSRDIPKLKEILTNISSRQYIRMQRRVDNIRRHFEVHYPPKRFDVFHMILHSVWLRRLNIRIYDD